MAVELAEINRVENGHGLVSVPYHLGKAGRLLRAAKAATLTGAGITAVAGKTRVGSILGGALLAAGSVMTRMGVFEAGMASAKDPKYTVVPQRERLVVRDGRVRSVVR